MVKILTGAADPKTIDGWKKENTAGIFSIEGDGHIGYFRKPTRHDVNKAMAEASDDEPLKGLEVLGELLFIGGSKHILTDDQVFLSASSVLKASMYGKVVEVKNL